MKIKVYARKNPYGEWQFIGATENLTTANKAENALNAQGYYTKREVEDKCEFTKKLTQ